VPKSKLTIIKFGGNAMQSSTSFNQSTINWHQPDIKIDTSAIAEYAAEQTDIESFQSDGAVLLKQVFADWVEPLRAGLQRNLDQPQNYAFPCESNPDGEPGRFFDSYCNWQLIPEYLDYLTHSCAASIAGQFMRSQSAQFFHDHAFMKAAGTQRATPWHQDLPYYCVDGTQSASVYVALDQADPDVAVQFVKGSHRWQQLYYPRVFEDGSNFNDGGESSMCAVPDIDAQPDQYDLTRFALEPGDGIVFDFRTLHGTSNAPVKSTRRAFSSRWLGDDSHYCERPGETSPNYRNHGMQNGDRMREDWFPVLWRSKGD
jgi:ectoine hydroxylase-related dioxygenase (phytanoyl-CoA dioxygenase family)